ncbi:hypothetical protein Tco_0654695 [Tanacetum coccineum]|uniref:Reverse transcriptase domain-containing protein n=1 Tax=Tanacetum coccineum TaxID=301880 RepID=A0ABQ4X4Y5_9ASTR
MVYFVDGVLASGVEIILEMDFVRFALQELEIHSFMIQIRTLSMILQTFSTTLHNPITRHTRVSNVGMILPTVMIVHHSSRFFDQPTQTSIDQLPHQEMSIQDMKDMKQQYLDEMKSMINHIQIKDYRNERIDIHYRKECEITIDEFKGKFNGMSIEINKKKELLQREQSANDEFIKSSVEDLVPIPRKILTLSNPLFDSNDDFTSSDDESLSYEDVSEDNVKLYSNPLFEFDDEYISSDVKPLFDKVLENIESKDSYVSNLDEPALLVTPLFDFNEDECFDPGGDVDEIELLLHCDPSTPKISVASILEGFTDVPPLEESDDLFYLESKENEWKNILYDAPINDLMTEDKVFNPGISAYSLYSLELVAYKCPVELFSSTCFVPNITMIWGE